MRPATRLASCSDKSGVDAGGRGSWARHGGFPLASRTTVLYQVDSMPLRDNRVSRFATLAPLHTAERPAIGETPEATSPIDWPRGSAGRLQHFALEYGLDLRFEFLSDGGSAFQVGYDRSQLAHFGS